MDMEDNKLAGKRILVVEDEESNYDLIRVYLKKYKPIITWAKDGQNAVEVFKNNQFDLILMDIQLPLMNGIEATKIIKEFNNQIPIIAQTAYAMSQDRQKAIDAGCNDYISKPMKRKDLISLIEKHIL